jgi:hypothetical protein
LTIVLPRVQGFLRGVITMRDGLPAAGASARLWRSGSPGDEARARVSPDGAFRLGPLPAGTYFLELHLDGEPTLHLDGIAIRADETTDLGGLRFAAGGRIRARVVDASGAPVSIEGDVTKEDVAVRSLDHAVTFSVRRDGEAFVSEELVAGRYLVTGGVAGILEEAEVKAGETTSVDLALRGGGWLEAVALDASGTAVWATFEIADPLGRRVGTGYCTLLLRLASGRYTVTATGASGLKDSREVEIPATGGRTQVALMPR